MELTERGFEKEFEFITSRSSGAGGQHVNKTNSKVELRFNVYTSQILNEEEKERIANQLSSSITKDGLIQIVSQTSRSQFKNKKNCITKFYELLEKSLKIQKVRKRIFRTFKQTKKRLEEKQKQAEKKERRRWDIN